MSQSRAETLLQTARRLLGAFGESLLGSKMQDNVYEFLNCQVPDDFSPV